MADVSEFVKNALLNVRKGLEDANSAGIQAEIPEKMDFALDIVSTAQSLTQATATENTEAAATDTETTERIATQDTGESGDDIEVSFYQYDSFEEA